MYKFNADFDFALYICKVKQKENIIRKLAKWILANKVRKVIRNKSSMNFKKAKSAVLVVDGLDSASEKKIKEFSNFLSQNNIAVDCIGFYNQKLISDDQNNCDISITKKNLNWLGIPKIKEYEKFLAKEYDLLFDFSLQKHFSLQCIIELSRSKFKIGMLPGNSLPYDFMIDLNKTKTISEYINQIKRYLPLL